MRADGFNLIYPQSVVRSQGLCRWSGSFVSVVWISLHKEPRFRLTSGVKFVIILADSNAHSVAIAGHRGAAAVFYPSEI